VEFEIEQAFFFRRGTQDKAAGPISENHRHHPAALGKIKRRGVDLGAHHQHGLVTLRCDEPGRQIERIEKARRGIAHIKGRDVPATEFVLQKHAGTGRVIFGRRGSKDDGIEILGFECGAGECRVCGGEGEIAHTLSGSGKAALMDTDFFANPRIRGGEKSFKFGVGNHSLRQGGSGGNDGGMHSLHDRKS
jgi:hypothetical protein